MPEHTPYGADGALDRMLRLGQKPKCTPAIFVHAGAGFHSHQNEHVHLQACVAAAEMGMKFLKAGATATEAIEAALRILEDKEITNAGYGSNLSIDGTVECDATIVDHLGRSGACGAVANIRNPIALAKLILDTSNNPLSLRRVPPNALVGEGAKAFAEEHGLTTYHNDYMISKNARDRFIRWQEDLKRADSKTKDTKTTQNTTQGSPGTRVGYLTATPGGSDNLGLLPGCGVICANARGPKNGSPPPSRSKTRLQKTETTAQGLRKGEEQSEQAMKRNADSHGRHHEHVPHRDGSASPYGGGQPNLDDRDPAHQITTSPRGVKRPVSPDGKDIHNPRARKEPSHPGTGNEDFITDTIGAIAVDENGHIAAGSSSGGIGMKHRGRLGPAALVGVGTAVVPCDENDEDQVTIAAVTSGTGEHMATTMASQRCAERIYHGTRRGRGGADIQDDDEDAIMESFIADDFMNHPGVKNCHSAGAIGVMVVKKCRTGYYLYFAHNTDSFALASMGGSEREPRCTMSRLPEGAKIAKGGRKVRLD
ncbi:hypothetical protein G7Z17_g9439 [Cylindrodendrum hubeiense]|uniref:Asparaginase n=1 Tax=Cylindrodendrum hubeiense TaxID=595255 RepID=A0A9P5H3B5_9HYPO|nr:hypothetical protein G7Z17_g9439 [Cylindrodendrum hubeiense]